VASLYTNVIYVISPLAEGDTDDIPCPDGVRLVVTDIDCVAGESAFTPELGFEDLVTGGSWFIAQTSGILTTSVQWVGRQAFNVGGGFRVNAHRGDWDIRVTGWFLTLP
jgi:hypothetical protein